MSEQKAPQAEQLLALALSQYTFGTSDSHLPFAVPVGGPRVVIPFRGGKTSLRNAISASYTEVHNRVPSSSAVADTMSALEGIAQRATPERLELRIARHGDSVLVDLGRRTGEVVQIRAGEWSVIEESPVLFRRTELTSEMPAPTEGSIDELRSLLNVTDEAWPLLVGWLVMSLIPEIPHPLLLLTGEQGTGKSVAASLIANLLDPSPSPLRTAPTDVTQWGTVASGSWVVAVDNVSSIPMWFSDALCRAVTGDGFVKRKLYSDDGISVVSFRRVVILTSIDAGALKGDLAERLLFVELERISKSGRRLQSEIDAAFAEAHPRILAGLFDLTCQVLKLLDNLRLDEMPRMADAARVFAAVDAIRGTDSLNTYLRLCDSVVADVVVGVLT